VVPRGTVERRFPRDRLPRILLLATIALLACSPASGDESASPPRIVEEMFALPFPLPVLAYVVRPLGEGPFPHLLREERKSGLRRPTFESEGRTEVRIAGSDFRF